MSNNAADGGKRNSTLSEHAAPPPLSAAFLIKFDLKVGYTITWKRSAPGVQLDGSVEFKSLPSGLHSVKEDLVYFIHDQYAGLSAFVNAPAGEEERNAALVAVGVLVPLSNARLGRGWLHAERLREMAATLAHDSTQTKILEQFWQDHKAESEEEAHTTETSNGGSTSHSTPSKHSRKRALSNLTNVLPNEQALPLYHPALSMMEFMDTFGPLVFPLWRNALLRKRILIMTSPPVRRACEFVFDVSILSSIPASVAELLAEDTEKFQRIRPLFQVGIHDIPTLEKEAKAIKEATRERSSADQDDGYGPFGYLACTTDEILTMKKDLYDIIVQIPDIPEYTPEQRQWPSIKTSEGTEIKATQRDLRRWKLLHEEIQKVRTQAAPAYYNSGSEEDDDTDNDQAALLRHSTTLATSPDDPGYDDKMIEPMTWSQLAYSGFLWWASAGERDAALADEEDRDRQILGRLADFLPSSPSISRSNSAGKARSMSSSHASLHTESAGLHTGIVAYFHRLTGQVISTMAEIVESADDDRESGDEGDVKQTVVVGTEDVGRMGLDLWSASDVLFVEDVARMYFGREADVRGGKIECCGMRVC